MNNRPKQAKIIPREFLETIQNTNNVGLLEFTFENLLLVEDVFRAVETLSQLENPENRITKLITYCIEKDHINTDFAGHLVNYIYRDDCITCARMIMMVELL